MRLPRSRRWRILAGVACVLVLVTGIAAVVFREELGFAAKLAVPGPSYDDADRRTSDAVARSDAAWPLPTVSAAPRPTGTDPGLRLGDLLELEAPSAVADPPGQGPVLVTTLGGRVHSVDLAAGTSRVVLDVADRISTGGERGLLGIAIDAAAERMYLDMTNDQGDTEVRSWPLDADGLPEPGDGVLHLEIGQPFANHNGGHLVFGPDGALWIGTGDGGGAADPGEVAQDPSSLLGKMLRVVPDPAGGVIAPTTNPAWGPRPEVWGIGLRNPWRYSFDRATNRLWIADVGQNTIEEVTVVDATEPKPNFGWDTVEGANDYEGSPSPEFTPPAVTYGHDRGCSITGGYVYRGEANPGLYGWYLYSDYCTGFIEAVPADDPTRDPVELAADLGGVIAFGELDDGELLLLTTEGIRPVTAIGQ